MKFKTLPQYCLPHHLMSRLVGAIAKCHWTWLKNLLINLFIKQYKIDLTTALEPNLAKYKNFNEFFTRALKPDARPLSKNNQAIISPIDGHISQIGKITQQQIIQAKGHNFTVDSLLGNKTTTFNDGYFTTLYLSPQDYHRVHMPLAGKLISMTYIPGRLFSVAPKVVSNIPNVYARNERVVSLFETEIGPMAVILVGAMLVASISTVWAGEITPPHGKKIHTWDYSKENIVLERGAEMGRFQFGSTVILLLPKNSTTWQQELKPEDALVMGQELGEKQ